MDFFNLSLFLLDDVFEVGYSLLEVFGVVEMVALEGAMGVGQVGVRELEGLEAGGELFVGLFEEGVLVWVRGEVR